MMTASATDLAGRPATSRDLFPTASAPGALLQQPVAGRSSDSPRDMMSSSSSSSAAGAGVPDAPLSPLEQIVAVVQSTIREARSWSAFRSLRALRLPRFDQITARAEHNLHVYKGNYKLICGAWSGIAVTLAFGRFLAAGLLLLLVERWVRAKLRAEGNLDINERALAAIFVLAIIWVTGVGECIVFAAFWSVVSVGLHAVLHDPPTDADDIEISNV
jgi:PRA1 family protein